MHLVEYVNSVLFFSNTLKYTKTFTKMLRTHEKYNPKNLEDMKTITKNNYIEYMHKMLPVDN